MVIHEFAALKALMQADQEYAWGFFCNLAVPIMDSVGCSHKQANEAAAHLMQHMWDVDMTTFEHYEYGKSASQEYAEFRIAADEAEDAALSESARAFWIEAEKAHAAKHAQRNPKP